MNTTRHRPPIETGDMHAHDSSPAATPDERFDSAMRGRHAAALDAVSPRVVAQLQQRRRMALAGAASRAGGPRRWGWPLGAAVAASCAALLAVAIGLQSPSTTGPSRGAPSVAGNAPAVNLPSIAAAGVDADNDGIADGGILDEDPDFYAWLASSDATALAME